jgi:hypothetical protein
MACIFNLKANAGRENQMKKKRSMSRKPEEM